MRRGPSNPPFIYGVTKFFAGFNLLRVAGYCTEPNLSSYCSYEPPSLPIWYYSWPPSPCRRSPTSRAPSSSSTFLLRHPGAPCLVGTERRTRHDSSELRNEVRLAGVVRRPSIASPILFLQVSVRLGAASAAPQRLRGRERPSRAAARVRRPPSPPHHLAFLRWAHTANGATRRRLERPPASSARPATAPRARGSPLHTRQQTSAGRVRPSP